MNKRQLELLVSDIAHMVEKAWEDVYRKKEPCFTFQIKEKLGELLGVSPICGLHDLFGPDVKTVTIK